MSKPPPAECQLVRKTPFFYAHRPQRYLKGKRRCFGQSTNLVRPKRNLTRLRLARPCTYIPDTFHPARNLTGEQRHCFRRSTNLVRPERNLSTYICPDAFHLAWPERGLSTYICPDAFHLAWPERNLSTYICPDAFHLAWPERNLSTYICPDAEIKQRNAKYFIFIISSFQLKSLGQTNLLVRRGDFTSCLTCTNGLVASNSRLTFIQICYVRAYSDKIQNLTSSLLCLTRSCVHGRICLFVRTTDCIRSLDWSKQLSLGIIHGRADILILTLSLEAYKESRQKRRLVVKHRRYKNLKTPILQCFIGTASNTIRLHSLGGLNLESLSSTYIPSNLAGPERNPTQTDDRCFGRIIRGRADTLFLTLLLEAYKESRQKRLVEHRKYNLKTEILQYFIDTAATINRLYSFDGINLDSLNSRNHTMYVLARPKRNLPPPNTYFSDAEAEGPLRACVRTYVLTCLESDLYIEI